MIFQVWNPCLSYHPGLFSIFIIKQTSVARVCFLPDGGIYLAFIYIQARLLKTILL
jgi:hypothetical protein